MVVRLTLVFGLVVAAGLLHAEDGKVEALVRQGRVQAASGNFGGAIALYREAQSHALPEIAFKIDRLLGQALYQSGDKVGGIKVLQRYLFFYPDSKLEPWVRRQAQSLGLDVSVPSQPIQPSEARKPSLATSPDSSEAVAGTKRWGAVWRSALVPGWGQIYRGQPKWGTALFLAELGAFAAGMHFLNSGNRNYDLYLAESTVDGAKRLRSATESDDLMATIFIDVAAGIYLAGILDSLIFTKSHQTLSLQTPGHGGLALAATWRY